MLGDGKWNSGNQGSFYKYQFGVLKLLEAISGGVLPPGGLATEATLLQVLAALQNGQEFEQNLVIDTGSPTCAGPNGCPTYLQVKIWDTVTHTFGPPRYFDANGVEFFLGGNPLYGPMQIVNPQNVLNNILAQVTAINVNTTGVSTAALQTALNALITTLNGLVATAANQVIGNASLSSIDGKLIDNFGIAAAALRTASLIGNAAGIADFGAGLTSAQTLRVVLPTDQSAIPVTGPLTDAQLRATPVPVSGTVTITPSGTQAVSVANGSDVVQGATTDAAVITDTSGTVSGKLRGLVKWAFERMPVALGQTTSAASLPVVIASNQSAVPISGTITATVNIQSGTATQTTVSVSTASVQVIAANVNRKGLIVTNVGGSAVYISFGTAPTTSLFAVSINTTAGAEKYEMLNAVYTGAVNAIRSSGTSNVIVTEFT